jgi:uncharacterized glyoxalase superfamily protein PhnB
MPTTTPPTLFPCLSYRDPAAAIDHLVNAFGFTSLIVVTGDGGTVEHAELTLGNGVLMLGTTPATDTEPWQSGTSCVCVAVDDLDAHHARAVAAGATITAGLRDTPYGSRDYTAEDTEGNVWVFGTYQPLAAREPAAAETS